MKHPSLMSVGAIQAELAQEEIDQQRRDELTAEIANRREQAQYNLGPSGIDSAEIAELVKDHIDISPRKS